jgi:hypothetical protein
MISKEEDGPKTKFVDLQFLLSISNVVERLFSLARLILTDERKNMSPIVFEAMLYLQKNREYWSVIDVAQAMRNKHKRSFLTAPFFWQYIAILQSFIATNSKYQ